MNDVSSTTRTWFERLTQYLFNEPKDRQQLIKLLREAQKREILDADALAMIEGVLLVSEMQVSDIMIPRSQTVFITQDQTFKQMLHTINDSRHSRFPLLNAEQETVLGILHAKDLLPFIHQNIELEKIHALSRPAVLVPESKRLDKLLKSFRKTHNHMAIVVDEYGSVAGIVTIEDVLEQIVGEIEDEFDFDDDTSIKLHGNNEYTVKALIPIEEFNDYFKTDFSTEDFDTLGGLVAQAFGHIPKRGETTEFSGFHFTVLHADNRQIHLLRVKIL